MSLFSKPKPTLDDPVFGRIEFDKKDGCWYGSAPVGPNGASVFLSVYGDTPSELQRERFLELGQRYLHLVPAITSELFSLYAPHLEHPMPGAPRPESATALWELLQFTGVDVQADGSLTLVYGFKEGLGWDDAMFEIKLDGWTPVGHSLGD